MPNTLLNVDELTNEYLRILHNKLVFADGVDRQYDDYFAQTGAKIGSSLRVRKPVQSAIRTGATISVQDVTETSETITMATQAGVDRSFSTQELTLNIDEFSDRYIKPDALRVAAQIEQDGLALYKDVYNHVGTPGTTPSTALVFLQAGQKLDECLAPRDEDRKAVVTPGVNAYMIDALKGLFHDGRALEKQFTKGLLIPSLGVKWAISAIVNAHTSGTRTNTTPLVNGGSQTGASLIIDGLAASATVTYGDVFVIAGVNAINPETKQSYGTLQQFVATANAAANGAGQVTLPISPSIIVSGATQTVSGSPADNAVITFTGTASTAYPQSMVYYKEAFALVTADLEVPQGVHFAARKVFDGISLRIVRQYTITDDKIPCRIDVLYGWKTLRPEFACRVTG